MADRPDFMDLKWWHHPAPPPRKRARVRPGTLVEVWLHPHISDGMTLGVRQDGRWRKVGWAPDFDVLEELYEHIDDPGYKQDLSRFFPKKEMRLF